MSTLQTLIVGVENAPADDGAVRAATTAARELGASVRLVHVAPDRHPLVPVSAAASNQFAVRGAGALDAAVARAVAMAPDLDIEAQLRRGGVASQLAEAAEDAAALYLGRQTLPRVERALRRDLAASLVARVACPVVSVPARWERRPAGGEVVAALKSAVCAPELFGDAFAEAELLGDRLVALHSWRLPNVYDDIIVSRVGPAEPARRSHEALEILLEEWRTSYPAVPVELRVVHAHPVSALVAASRAADLLVLAGRPHRVSAGVLGCTGRAVLRDAECPVRVIPPEAVGAAGRQRLRAGEVVA